MNADQRGSYDIFNDLLLCCGSRKWAEAMANRWPFADTEAMLNDADAVWRGLDVEDWLEAFRAHPKIGERTSSTLSRQEQSGAASASADQTEELARLNRDYERRFGFIFIICATGKTAEEMLGALRERLRNLAEVEINVAAEQQRLITRLRLSKLFSADPSSH
jgi:OHCU decarboxylase